MSAIIDTLRVSKAFEGAGFAKGQAETLATTIAEATSTAREELVTKDYLKAEIAGLKNELVRWVIGSQVALVAILATLANFTKIFN
jgi:hypothetical protein